MFDPAITTQSAEKKRDPLPRLADGAVDTEKLRVCSHLLPDPGSEVVCALLDVMDTMTRDLNKTKDFKERHLRVRNRLVEKLNNLRRLLKVSQDELAVCREQLTGQGSTMTLGLCEEIKRVMDSWEQEADDGKPCGISYFLLSPKETHPGQVIDEQEKIISKLQAEVKEWKDKAYGGHAEHWYKKVLKLQSEVKELKQQQDELEQKVRIECLKRVLEAERAFTAQCPAIV